MLRPLLVAIALLLAGCTSDSEPEPQRDESTSTLGSISGSVVTPAIMPIPGATVTIPQAQISDTTSLFGGFKFEALPPGVYRLEATAPDHEPGNVTVTVVAGEKTKARIVLKQDLPPVADSATEKLEGFIEAGFGPADPHAGPVKEAAGVGNCTCVLEFDAPEALRTVVLDAFWDDSFSARPMELRFNVSTDAGRSASFAGAAPFNVHVQDVELDLANATRITITVSPDEVRPTQDLRFTLLATWWTVDPAPEGWRFEGE